MKVGLITSYTSSTAHRQVGFQEFSPKGWVALELARFCVARSCLPRLDACCLQVDDSAGWCDVDPDVLLWSRMTLLNCACVRWHPVRLGAKSGKVWAPGCFTLQGFSSALAWSIGKCGMEWSQISSLARPSGIGAFASKAPFKPEMHVGGNM